MGKGSDLRWPTGDLLCRLALEQVQARVEKLELRWNEGGRQMPAAERLELLHQLFLGRRPGLHRGAQELSPLVLASRHVHLLDLGVAEHDLLDVTGVDPAAPE